jgi:hypothetical protein
MLEKLGKSSSSIEENSSFPDALLVTIPQDTERGT